MISLISRCLQINLKFHINNILLTQITTIIFINVIKGHITIYVLLIACLNLLFTFYLLGSTLPMKYGAIPVTTSTK